MCFPFSKSPLVTPLKMLKTCENQDLSFKFVGYAPNMSIFYQVNNILNSQNTDEEKTDIG